MPRTLKLSLTIFTLVLLCAPAALARQGAPDPQLEQGVALYRKGDAAGAAREFRTAAKRRRTDPLAWVYLAQALIQGGDLKEARKALDAALKLNRDYAPAHSSLAYLHLVSGNERDAEAEATKALALEQNLPSAHYVLGNLHLRQGEWLKALEEADAAIKLDAAIADAYSLKTQALLALYDRASAILGAARNGDRDHDDAMAAEARAAQSQRLRQAAESLTEYLRLRPEAADADELREELEAIRFYAELGASSSPDPAQKVYNARDGINRAVILAKPEPGFTEQARQAGVQGFVRLRVVLGADGTVKHILPIRWLGYGLTENAIAAARQMKFRPATLDGQPVSQYVILEYNFAGDVREFRQGSMPRVVPTPDPHRP